MPMSNKQKRLKEEKEQLVIETIRMRLNEKQSIAYLKGQGMEMPLPTFYRIKARVESQKLSRLFAIGQEHFVDQHLARIDNTELGLKLLWQCYVRERSPFRQAIIIEKIIALQPYLSSFYESTKEVVEKSPIIQEKLKALQNRLKEDEIMKEAVLHSNQSEDRILQLIQKLENEDKDKDNDLKEKKIKEDPNKFGIQHIDSISKKGEDNSISSDRRESETGGTSPETETAEDIYRREKGKGIFYNSR